MQKSALIEQDNDRLKIILAKLAEYYPRAKTSLVFSNPYQLFVATILSAQTTDEQVNKITSTLFKAVPSFADMSKMEPAELESYIQSCGLYRQKSKSLVVSSRIIIEKYGGDIPADFTQLVKLPGVGRKTANIIIGSVFGKPAIAVDTHVFRVSRRLGLADGGNVEQVEEQLKNIIPVSEWINSHHRLIAHGRRVCHARKPDCENCFLNQLCLYVLKRGDTK
ncbi:MAG: endonuclease III [Bacillota bacterium]|nr:endonuclease III [Bacillota bacterium]